MNETSNRRQDGLSTREGLQRLHDAMRTELLNHEDELLEKEKRPFRCGTWVYDAFHNKSPRSTFPWPSALLLALSAALLFASYIILPVSRYDRLPAEAVALAIIVVINLYLVGADNRLRHQEMFIKATALLDYIKGCIDICVWQPNQHPDFNMPASPCITLQLTYRNGYKVNLHWALLVEGDVIILRPGQAAPGRCRPLDDEADPELRFGEIFAPALESPREYCSGPKIRAPLVTKRYILLETPYISTLRMALKKSRDRPLSILDKERHLVLNTYLLQVVIPMLTIIMLAINILRYIYLQDASGHWTEMIFTLQIATVLPLLPIALPLCWILLNAYGTARVMAAFSLSKHIQRVDMDPFDELGETSMAAVPAHIIWSDIRHCFWNLLLGKEYTLYRTANLLHVFGSVTALCCIDKKGVLSWPNPTAEKVFFLRSSANNGLASRDSLLCHSEPSLNEDIMCVKDSLKDPPASFLDEARRIAMTSLTMAQKLTTVGNFGSRGGYMNESSCIEVLDLTHDNQVPFRVQFDDPRWKRHINSLKPLGLAILLNTCNGDTQDLYTEFSFHIACESLHNDVVVPVINRRCLCELARQIGFLEQAQDVYQLQQQLSTFRHVQPEQARRDKLAKSLSISKLKFPFPNMVSVVIKELNTGMLQLMSQGTGDIILDSCSDFWDGHDLCHLGESDRKKILDFYHRTSLTSYCTAFSYRPLTTPISSDLGKVYLEIPSDCSQLYSHMWSPTSPRTWDLPPMDDRTEVLNRCLSSDSLLGHSCADADPVTSAESCFETQCNQVFIGMVTMQYQAMADIVHLIEQLDKACVRFVHFSKENELRSRVFSEKMGLESGWNCHVSLLAESGRSENGNSTKASRCSLAKRQTSTDEVLTPSDCAKSLKAYSTLEAMRQFSVSAPSAINLDVSTVKFEDEISLHNLAVSDDMSELAGLDQENVSDEMLAKISGRMSQGDRSSQVCDVTEALIHDEADSHGDGHPSRSPSHITESTDQSAPIAFDMSNRAKLPKGIDQIRPHLENIDNVPLLVSLFTDCTSNATAEMFKIMQDYGEVVCCVGSSASCHNMRIFTQADASIGIEPLYPQLCLRQPVFEETPAECGPAPIELSRQLNSLACSLALYREDPIGLYHLIMEARHFTTALRHVGHFMLAAALGLTIVQILASLLLLPPLLTVSHLIVILGLTLPVLAVSLIGNPVDPQVMSLATGKNDRFIDKTLVLNFVAHNGAKFLPSLLVCLLCFLLTLSSFCKQTSSPDRCYPLLGNRNFSRSHEWNGFSSDFVFGLYTAQNLAAFQLVLYFTCISASFVHKGFQLWSRSPFMNKAWCCAVIFALSFQAIYFVLDLYLRSFQVEKSFPNVGTVPVEVWVIGVMWTPFAIAINEMVKRQDIKVNVRYQKRARLEFGTKLGMNSPF